MQKTFEAGKTERVAAIATVGKLQRVAAMSECDPDTQLVITTTLGARLLLPLTYLSQLWPQPFTLDAPLDVDRSIEVSSSGAGALVVLMGTKR